MVLVSSKSECCSSWKNCKRSFSVLFRSMPKISSLVIFVFTPPIRYRPSSSSPRTSMISMHLRANAKPTSSSRYSSLFLDLPGAKYVYRKIVCTHTKNLALVWNKFKNLWKTNTKKRMKLSAYGFFAIHGVEPGFSILFAQCLKCECNSWLLFKC